MQSVALLFGDTLVRLVPWVGLATPVMMLSVSALFTLLVVHRVARLNVVEAIRTGEERPRHRKGGIRGGILKGLPLSLAMGLRDLISQPVRAALTMVGLGMAVITIVSALTLRVTLQAIFSDPSQLGFEGDLDVRRSTYISEEEVFQIIAAQPEVVAYYSERWRGFQFPGEDRYYYARFREGDMDAFRFPLVEGRMFEGHGEAVAGYGLVHARGIGIGDELEILIDDQPLSLRVVGLYRENSNNGRMLLLPSETLRRVLPDFETYTFVLKLHPGVDVHAVAEAMTEASNGFLGARVMGEEELPGHVRSLPRIMTALTLVLGGIAAIGVFNSVWMTVQERSREFGMLKSVGMTPRQVILSVLTGVTALAVAAYILGLPVGLVGIRALMSTVARSIGFGPLEPWTDKAGLALLLPGVMLLTLIGAFIPAYRAGRTSVVEVLRYE